MAVQITYFHHQSWPQVLQILSLKSTHPAIFLDHCFIGHSFGISETVDFWSYLEDAVDNAEYHKNRDGAKKIISEIIVDYFPLPETMPFVQPNYSTQASEFDPVCQQPVIADKAELFGTYSHTFDFHTFVVNYLFISDKFATVLKEAELKIYVCKHCFNLETFYSSLWPQHWSFSCR